MATPGSNTGAGGSSTRPANGAVAVNSAATAVSSADARFDSQQPHQLRQSRWAGCFSGLSCFGSQKGGKRIVPAARMADGNASTNRGNALQSAFSTFTTEPSTAPLTPPPELAHATTPSSPDVPYARFLSSYTGPKTAGKEQNMHYLSTTYSGGLGLQGSYPLYPGSPSSSLISPASVTPRTGLSSPIPEQDVPTAHWRTSRSVCDTPYSIASPIPEQEVPTTQSKTSRSACDTPYSRTSPSNIFGLDSAAPRNCLLDSNFFRPAASAQFYLDQAQQSFLYNGGRLSVSRDKQDADEVEAYRASFGFSADEIVATQHYVEIPDALDDGFSISPFGNNAPATEVSPFNDLPNEFQKVDKMDKSLFFNAKVITSPKKSPDQISGGSPQKVLHLDIFKGTKAGHLSEDDATAKDCHPFRKARDEISLKPIEVRKRSPPGQACSDAEIEYRRARSLREANGVLSWRSTLSRQLQ
ncbi:hypothetical protein ACQJBY_033216 [Aegilops geniculata]